MDLNIVKKNNNDFSFVHEVINEVNNLDYKQGVLDFYNNNSTKLSYIWEAISAVANDIGEDIYLNILNYILNISDIDTCNIKALESMIKILGSKFSIFESLKDCPLEIENVINIFSMRKEYLLNSNIMSKKFISELSGSILSVDESTVNYINNINNYRKSINFQNLLSSSSFILNDRLDKILYDTLYDILSTNISLTYNTVSSDHIYNELKTNITLLGFELPNDYAEDIYNFKIQSNIPISYNQEEEVDKIENGLSTLSNYTETELVILGYEIKRRNKAKSEIEQRSRYSYYRERKVKDYFNFIENNFNSTLISYLSSKIYDVDNNYIEINKLKSNSSLFDGTNIKWSMVESVASALVSTTNLIREIREYLKSQPLRVFMKGTFLLIKYAIKEYFKNTIYPSLNKLSSSTLSDYNIDSNVINLIEYADPTEYHNIKTDIDSSDKRLNEQFWINSSTYGNLNSIDTTNILKGEEKSVLTLDKIFDDDDIEDFYVLTLNSKFKEYHKELRLSLLNEFLNDVFSVGADNSYYKNNNVECELSTDLSTRVFTSTVTNYLSSVKDAIQKNQHILSTYTPSENVTVNDLLVELNYNYKENLQAKYEDELNNKSLEIDEEIAKVNDMISLLDFKKQEYDSLVLLFNTIILQNSIYTGDYLEKQTDYLEINISKYRAFIIDFDFNAIHQYSLKDEILDATASLDSQCNNLKDEIIGMKNYIEETKTFTDYYSYFNDEDIIILLTYENNSFINGEYFYDIYVNNNNNLTSSNQTSYINQLTFIGDTTNVIVSKINTIQLKTVEELSNVLSDYLMETFNINQSYEYLSSKLDYSLDPWYVYKKNLFLKYTGLSIGETPYYYIKNSIHPSYLIHQCLRNFVHYQDLIYPVKNLAGIANNIISSMAINYIDNYIDNSGYLLSIWNNPLNGNSDYLTKYEKSNHIDEANFNNKYYGYDGLYHPYACKLHLLSNWNMFKNEYSNQNISEKEYSMLQNLYNTYTKFYEKLTSEIDYIRFAVDIYGNGYYLLSSEDSSINNTLWMKYKNRPVSYLALAYVDNKFSNTLSLIKNVSENNQNLYFSQCSSSFITVYDNIKTPNIYDFIINKNKNILLFVVKKDSNSSLTKDHIELIPVHIKQEYYKTDEYDLYIRTFNVNSKTYSDHLNIDSLDSSLKFNSFYTYDNSIGCIFSNYSSNKLKLAIVKYDSENELTSTKIISTEISNCVNEPKIAYNSDGKITIALKNNTSFDNKSTNNYIGNIKNTRSLTSYINEFKNNLITLDYKIVDDKFVFVEKRSYNLYVDMGFIPIYKDTNNNIYDTDLYNDFDNNVLKFLIIGDKISESSSYTNGIDFKYVYPLRMYEDNNQEKIQGIEDNFSYLRTDVDKKTRYILKYEDIHYLELEYNKYVQNNIDASYWDYIEDNRGMYLSVDPDKQKQLRQFGDYQDLANYDVSRYLLARRTEDYNLNIIDLENIDWINYPYLMSSDVPSVYISAYNIEATSIPNGNYKILIDKDYELSVNVIVFNNKIKLDFNPIYYKSKLLNNDNTRNKYHLFLNLDRPGDYGYLQAIHLNNGEVVDDTKVYVIKNISEGFTPKFIIKRVNAYVGMNDENKQQVIGFSYNENDVVLRLDSFDEKVLSFE